MRFEIENGDYVGTAEWTGPGQVTLEMDDHAQRKWFEDYFKAEDSHMNGPVECAEMTSERRDESQASFQRAAYQLAAHAYKVRAGGSRHHRA